MEGLFCKQDTALEMKAIQDTLYVLGGKWKIAIVNAVYHGNTRFRDIERAIPSITTRMLSRQLKELEMNKLIIRKVDDSSPGRVEYEVTEYCMTFGPVIQEMITWGIEHRRRIMEG